MVALPRTCERCGEQLHHYGRCRCMPGTLTVMMGGISVTLDPLDSDEKFYKTKGAITEMLTALDLVHSDDKHKRRSSIANART